jgi:hypothetical protein
MAMRPSTPNPHAAARARDFLLRQNAGFEALLLRLEDLASGKGDLAAFIADGPALDEERSRYDREAEQVRNEWNTISKAAAPETRAEIDALARRGEALVAGIQTAYARAIRSAEVEADDTRAALHALAHGRGAVRRYAFGNQDDALYIDRKA